MVTADPDFSCPGNVGCTEQEVECGACACTLCWGETCLTVTCDDGGSPECPWPEPDGGDETEPETTAGDDGESQESQDIDSPDAPETDNGPEPDGPSGPTPPEGTCTVEQACEDDGGFYCLAPGATPCGDCAEPDKPCEDDTDCQEWLEVCEPDPVPCPCGATWGCKAPCQSAADCDDLQVCDGGGHCVMPSCEEDADCHPNHSCVEGSCQRGTCASSDQCDDWCVLGACYDTPGSCTDPLPQ